MGRNFSMIIFHFSISYTMISSHHFAIDDICIYNKSIHRIIKMNFSAQELILFPNSSCWHWRTLHLHNLVFITHTSSNHYHNIIKGDLLSDLFHSVSTHILVTYTHLTGFIEHICTVLAVNVCFNNELIDKPT